MCCRIFQVKGSYPLDERLHASLLENAHERGLEGLACIGRHLCNGSPRAGALLDVAAGDLLELKVSGNVRRYKDVGQFARGHEKLGDEVDVPVIESPVLLPWLLALRVIAVLLEELLVGQHDAVSRDLLTPAYRFEIYGCGLSVENAC